MEAKKRSWPSGAGRAPCGRSRSSLRILTAEPSRAAPTTHASFAPTGAPDLAALEHPNLARLIDGGATSDGVPKLLDFGIGKVLDAGEASDRTAMTLRVLTPEYAAPEQVRSGAITTATDVHGLGVLLYEILTGTHPFRSGATTPHELHRALLESTPSTPSAVVTGTGATAHDDATPTPSQIAELRGTAPGALRRRLRGELDNIVLKALRKEPDRRYTSAEAMREDLRRHLKGLPVQARPDSFAYRASKFATRNPWGVAAA